MKVKKFGVIVICHGKLATDLIKVSEYITGESNNIVSVNVEKDFSVSDIKKKLEEKIKQVDRGNGVLILTDMFGGTPSNVSLSFMKEKKVEVISGVNLPMLLKILTAEPFEGDLNEFANFIKSYGQKNIVLASEILKGDEEGKKEQK